MTKPYFVNHLNEDDLFGRLPQISKVDHTPILNFDLGDQSKVFKYFNEDDYP